MSRAAALQARESICGARQLLAVAGGAALELQRHSATGCWHSISMNSCCFAAAVITLCVPSLAAHLRANVLLLPLPLVLCCGLRPAAAASCCDAGTLVCVLVA